MGYSDLVKAWRDHPEDYIVICDTLNSVDGEGVVGYHIVNVTKSISHVIEKQSMVRKLAQEMLDAGVRLVTMDEAMRIIYHDQPERYEAWKRKRANRKPDPRFNRKFPAQRRQKAG